MALNTRCKGQSSPLWVTLSERRGWGTVPGHSRLHAVVGEASSY